MKAQKIKSIIFDMDGVLWKENTPLVDLPKIFEELDRLSIRYAFATNNSSKSPADYERKINNFGCNVSSQQIVTSASVLVKIISQKYPLGGPVYIIGESGLHETLREYGFYHQNDDVLAVVGGLDRSATYQTLAKAVLLLNSGVDFYFTNIDASYPSSEGDLPGAGAILTFLETASGKKAFTVGKPKTHMFTEALNILNTHNENTIVVGDRLETDIMGGKIAKCHTALVLSGISTVQNIEETQIYPDIVCTDLDDFLTTMRSKNWEINE
jgi:4-nitrophenyl phosphatase